MGWEESIIRLIFAEAEDEALLGLAELGNIYILGLLSTKFEKSEGENPSLRNHFTEIYQTF